MRSPERPINPNISQMATKGAAVPGRTPPDVLGGPKKKGIGKGVRNALIAGTALTVLGGAAAYETIPPFQEAVHRTIGLGNGGDPDVIKADKFEDVPSRGPDINQALEHDYKIPDIKRYTEIPEGGIEDNFNRGIRFRLQERPPTEVEVQIMTPDGQRPLKTTEYHYPDTQIDAYVLKKEINPDGSVMLAIGIPGRNGLFTQADIDKSLTTVDKLSPDSNEGQISKVIVWAHLKSYSGNNPRLSFSAYWANKNFSNRGVAKITEGMYTNQPEEVYRYIRVGDPLSVIADNSVSSLTEQELRGDNQQEYSTRVNRNGDTIRRMLEDAKSGGVSLKQQFENKTYPLEIWSMRFLPRP